MKRVLSILILTVISAVVPLKNHAENIEQPDFKPSYMGTVEAGHVFPWSHFLRATHGMVTLTTIHGVQIKPWFFTGAGVGALMFYSKNGIGFRVPFYINGRLTLPKEHFRPFFDFKFGIADSKHILFNPSIGYKFAWGRKGGVRLSFGANIFASRWLKGYNGVSATLGFDF